MLVEQAKTLGDYVTGIELLQLGDFFDDFAKDLLVHCVASGDLSAKVLFEGLKNARTTRDIWRIADQNETFGGKSDEFRDFITNNKKRPLVIGGYIIPEGVNEVSGKDGAEKILRAIRKDPKTKDEYEFRICSEHNYSNANEALSLILKYGMDRDLSINDNLFWSARGFLWGGGVTSKHLPGIVVVYHDPGRIMDLGHRRLDEGAMGFYGLVKNNMTLRDMIAGVVIVTKR